MFRNLVLLKDKLLRLNTAWQSLILILSAVAWLALKFLDLPEYAQSIQDASLIASSAVFVLAALLYVALFVMRRRQIHNCEVNCLLSKFRTPEELSDVFSRAVTFKEGEICFRSTVPTFSFMRIASSEDDVAAISDINRIAFKGTRWAGNRDEKLKRNLDFWRANRNVFMVIDLFDDDLIGDLSANAKRKPFFFSCIIPLTKRGYERYFFDKVSGDVDFRADWIAGEDEPAHSLLLFTIARDPHLAASVDALAQSKLVFLYMRCLAVHIQVFLDQQPFVDTEFPLYFQNSGAAFLRLATLARMDKSQLRTKDNETVYVSQVTREPSD